MLFENRLQYIKVNRAHLGSKDGIALRLHFCRIFCPMVSNRLRDRIDMFLAAHSHGGNQTANPNTDGAEIVDFIDFKQCVKLVAVL